MVQTAIPLSIRQSVNGEIQNDIRPDENYMVSGSHLLSVNMTIKKKNHCLNQWQKQGELLPSPEPQGPKVTLTENNMTALKEIVVKNNNRIKWMEEDVTSLKQKLNVLIIAVAILGMIAITLLIKG